MEDKHAGLYVPLRDDGSQIRLLTIQPGRTGDVICDLNVAEAQNLAELRYETISYVWGDASKRGFVVLNGHHVDVPESAEAVLRRVRLPDKARVVWIDAVCVNQSDDTERADQVQMMGRIYSGSTNNLIHLYREDNVATPNLVRRLVEDAEANGQLAELYDERDQPNYKRGFVKTPIDTPTLIDLFGSVWFRRVWTFQEAYLPKKSTCLCGPYELDFLDVLRAGTLLLFNGPLEKNEDDTTLRYFLPPISLLQKRIDGSYGRRTNYLLPHPLNLLEAVWTRQCQRDNDMVYGALGLMPQLGLIPDYGKSKELVYQEFAVSVIKEMREIGILNYAHRTQVQQTRNLARLPSWVPDWDQPYEWDDHGRRLSATSLAGADRSSEVSARFEPGDGAILNACGVYLDRVTVGAGTNPYSEEEDSYRAMAMIRKLAEVMGNDKKGDTAIAATLCVGRDWQGRPVSEHAILAEYEAWIKHLREKRDIPPLSDVDERTPRDTAAASRYDTCVWQTIHHRELFYMLALKAFGLGPGVIQDGDVVVLLNGYRWPAILRPKGKRYLFMGNAYIYGFMHGELFRDPATAKVNYAYFEIC